MRISSQEVQQILSDLEKKLVHYCLICGDDCRYNVCIKCEAKAEARKVLFYCYRDIKEISKKITNERYREYQTKQLIEGWNKKINCSDLSCYSDSEQQIIHSIFWAEIKAILESDNYFESIYKPISTGKPTIQPQYILENLRTENIQTMCLSCKSFPCRHTSDPNTSMKIIKKCAGFNA